MKKQKQFVLSSSEFANVKDAEAKVNAWFSSGHEGFKKNTKLYEAVTVYDMKLKFVKRSTKKK